MEHKHVPKKRGRRDLINGSISGLCTVLFTQPSQVIRTSMMVKYFEGKPAGLFHITHKIFIEEGFKGFFRSITPTLIKTPIINSKP